MRRIHFGAVLMAIAVALGTQQLAAQTQKQAEAVTSHSHNIGGGTTSPFYTQTTNQNGTTVYDFNPAAGLSGSIVAGAADTTTVSGTITVVGNANASTNFNDGNRLPKGITLTYDLSFTISTTDDELVSAGGNTGNGLGPGVAPYSAFDPGEAVEFSAATISNIAFTGTPTDPSVTFTPGTVSGVGLSQFRSANFPEATAGAILDNGTDTVGFGISTGTVASSVIMNNGFSAAARFPAMMMDTPITLTNDAAAGAFHLKGIELTTFFDYEFDSAYDDVNVAVVNFSHNIGSPVSPVSPFVTQSTGDDATVYDFTDEKGLAGSIVAGAANTTTVSGTVEIIGNATVANDFANGNQLPEGVTLSYDLSFNISSPDGLLTTAGGNTGNGIGVGPAQYEAINDGEQLVFSPATISNVTFTGAPVDGSAFVPGNVTDVALDCFRTNNFGEAVSGAVLSNGSDSVGFGLATGSLASAVGMNNGFIAADRFPALSMLNQLTLTADTGASTFNLKGFELMTAFTYDTGVVLLGDVNQDGSVDFSDITPFIAVLSGGLFQAEADCDESGVVDFSDISAFIDILSGQ